MPTTADPAAALAFIHRQCERAASGQGYSFAIADAVSDVGLGQIGLWPQRHGRASIGYWVAPSAGRRGAAQNALHMVSAWALTLPGLHRLELYVKPWNEGSWRAAERAGYFREGLLRSWQQVGDQRRRQDKPETASRDSACYICADPRVVSAPPWRAERASVREPRPSQLVSTAPEPIPPTER